MVNHTAYNLILGENLIDRKAKLDPTCLRAIGQCSSRYGPTAFIKARFSFVVCLADVETELYGQ